MRILSIPTIKSMNKIIPKNSPKSLQHKYIYIFNKNYDILLEQIYSVSLYSTFSQFQALYKKMNKSLSDNYIKKKSSQILKELKELKFIEVDYINNNKYFYLKKAAIAIFTNDYNKVPRINHKKNMQNNRFLISLIKLEYFILSDINISLSNLNYHLRSITKKIHYAVTKYQLSYNISDIEYILNEFDIKKIQKKLEGYSSDNILRLIWFDLYNIYYKLSLQHQTVFLNPKYFNLYIVDKTLRIHYVPNIIIFDFHDVKYYQNKINSLFHDFFNINTNVTSDIQSNYKSSKTLGLKQNNRIGYSMTIIGYDKASLMDKIHFINTSLNNKNSHSPLVDNVNFIHVDISKYLSHSSQKNKVFDSIENYVDTKMQILLANKFN